MSILVKVMRTEHPDDEDADDCASLPDLVPLDDSSDDESADEAVLTRTQPEAWRANVFSRYVHDWVYPGLKATARPRPARGVRRASEPSAASFLLQLRCEFQAVVRHSYRALQTPSPALCL